MLTLKLTMLLALTSASRCSEIRHLDNRFYTKSEGKICFNVIKPTKTSKANKPFTSVRVWTFSRWWQYLRFLRLEEYIFRAKPWREKSNHNQLLLSHIEPHSPVKTCTLSRWICQVLKYAGINTKMFTSHSVRAASTSKAKTLGISLSQILKKGQWSKESTWQKFYNKEIFPEATTFQSILALWTEDEESSLLETCAVRLGEFSIRSTEILWSKIENYNKARSACIIIKIIWIKLKYDLILSLPPQPIT